MMIIMKMMTIMMIDVDYINYDDDDDIFVHQMIRTARK